jgi:hypothetical protein
MAKKIKKRKGRMEKKACLVASLQPWKLFTPIKTKFASKVATFQQALKYILL